MKIEAIRSNMVFKSGYPTFNSGGHLSYNPLDTYDHVFLYHRPSGGILKTGSVVNYLA